MTTKAMVIQTGNLIYNSSFPAKSSSSHNQPDHSEQSSRSAFETVPLKIKASSKVVEGCFLDLFDCSSKCLSCWTCRWNEVIVAYSISVPCLLLHSAVGQKKEKISKGHKWWSYMTIWHLFTSQEQILHSNHPSFHSFCTHPVKHTIHFIQYLTCLLEVKFKLWVIFKLIPNMYTLGYAYLLISPLMTIATICY